MQSCSREKTPSTQLQEPRGLMVGRGTSRCRGWVRTGALVAFAGVVGWNSALAQEEPPARSVRPAKVPDAVKKARDTARELRRARRAQQQKPAKPVPPSDLAGGQPRLPPPAANPAANPAEVPGEKEFNECVRLPRGRRIKITLKPESELKDLVGWISSMTCKKFIVPSNVRSQKITLISPTPVTPGAAYRAFLSALEAMGLTVVPSGQYLKVIQSNWAIQSPVPTYTDKDRGRLPSGDTMITHITRVENVDVGELLLLLNKIKSRNGDVTAYKATNSLIITDAAANVKRMLRIIKELDVPLAGEKIWVVRMRFADSQEVLKVLQQVFAQAGGRSATPRGKPSKGGKGGKGGDPSAVGLASASKMVADPLTNSLIILASPASFSRIASLIEKLDSEGEGSSQRIHVYYLENGDAEEIAGTLSNLTSGAQRRAGARGKRAAGGGANASATLFEGDVKVTGDKATNSLVIVASTKDYLAVRRVVKQLDIPRRQVFVEAIILEVSLNKERSVGVSVHGGMKVGSGSSESMLFGGLFPSQEFNSLLLNPAALTGLAAGARGALIEGSGKLLGLPSDIPGFGVLLQLLQTNNNLNVLSAPHIMTTDNQEAEIVVGQNLPFQGAFMGSSLGAAAGAAGAIPSTLLPSISVQRQDVALTLKLTPHVNESDMVRLELQQEVSDIIAENFNNLGPATSKRTVKTTVVVRDQQTVVIGGLMADAIREEESKIPLLGDIPILGYLFKHKTKSYQKTNLLLVLTPHIIRDQSDLRRIFRKKLEERREFLERYTAFKAKEVEHDIDYRHKRGLVGEIHRVGLQAEQEADLIRQARTATAAPEPLEVPQGVAPAPEASAPKRGGPPAAPDSAPAKGTPRAPKNKALEAPPMAAPPPRP